MHKIIIGLALLLATACNARARAPEYSIPTYDLEAKRYESTQRIAAATPTTPIVNGGN